MHLSSRSSMQELHDLLPGCVLRARSGTACAAQWETLCAVTPATGPKDCDGLEYTPRSFPAPHPPILVAQASVGGDETNMRRLFAATTQRPETYDILPAKSRSAKGVASVTGLHEHVLADDRIIVWCINSMPTSPPEPAPELSQENNQPGRVVKLTGRMSVAVAQAGFCGARLLEGRLKLNPSVR